MSFYDTFINKVDKKGRVSIPVSFRSTLKASKFYGVTLSKCRGLKCIEGNTRETIEMFTRRVHQQYGQGDPRLMALSVSLFAGQKEAPCDPESRIVLPDQLRDFAGIDDHAAIVGIGPKFMIWNPNAYKVFEEEQMALADDAYLDLPSLYGDE